MPILHSYRNKNFVTSFVHVFLKLNSEEDGMKAFVRSYVDMEAFTAGVHNWHENHVIPIGNVSAPEEWLISEAGPFPGGSILPEQGELEIAKAVATAQMKAMRDSLEVSGFPYLGKFFDSNQKAYNRMNGAKDYVNSLADTTGYEIQWTLADNTSTLLTADNVRGMLPALAVYAQGLQNRYTERKEAIAAAETVAAVKEAAQW